MLSSAAVALIAGAATTVIPASAATSTCSTLQNDINSAGAGAIITLHDTSLCTSEYTIPDGTSITLQGQTQADGFDGQGTHRLLHGSNLGAMVVRNLTFQHGLGSSTVQFNMAGAASGVVEDSIFINNDGHNGGFGTLDLRSQTGPLTLRNNVVGGVGMGNISAFGGAVDVDTSGAIVVDHNQVIDNVSNSGGAGGIDVFGSGGAISFTNNLVSGNTATGGGGGGAGIHDFSPGTIAITGNFFLSNTLNADTGDFPANIGGGLDVAIQAATGTVTQANNLFKGNQVHELDATETGGLDYGGGGEYAQAELINSTDDTFVGNTVYSGDGSDTPVGGGLAIQGLNGRQNQTDLKTTLHAYNLVANNNTVGAGGEGGGIYAGTAGGCSSPVNCPSEVDLFDSTVTGNSVGTDGTGSGLAGDDTDTATVVNSIVTGNSGNQRQVNGFGTLSVNHTDACQDAAAAYTGTGNVCKDPKLANVSGHDVHETAASPTIDAGDSAQVPAGLTQDYEADGRVLGAAVDMGADEFVPAVPTLPAAGAGPHPAAPAWPPFLALLAVPALVAGVEVAQGLRRRRGRA